MTRAYDTVGRIGGDEFVVLCEDIDSSYDIHRIAHRFLALCAAPVTVGELQLSVAASVGIAVSGTDGTDAAVLLDEADTAMYRAKFLGGDRVEYFDPFLQIEMVARYDREVGLRQAIADDELHIRFDAIVNPAEDVVAVRASAGWTHEQHGFIDHQAVAAVAHSAGLAAELDDWMLDRALAEVAYRSAARSHLAEPFVVVDVDGLVLAGADFAIRLIALLDLHRVDPRSLCIAIDGHFLVEHAGAVKPVLDEIAGLGVRIARQGVMETGSAYTYLSDLPIDIIVLDDALTDELLATDTELLGVVIGAAKGRGRTVVAGSSSDAQFETLTGLGVDLVQRSQPIDVAR